MLPSLFALAIVFAPPPGSTTVCTACVKAHVEHLAAPALNGRRCATADEGAAAAYLVGELKAAHVAGALPGGAHLQTVELTSSKLASPASLTIGAGSALVQGKDFVGPRGLRGVSGGFVRVTDAAVLPASVSGAVVFFDGTLDRTDRPPWPRLAPRLSSPSRPKRSWNAGAIWPKPGPPPASPPPQRTTEAPSPSPCVRKRLRACAPHARNPSHAEG